MTATPDPQTVFLAALDYARQGYRVLPLRRGTKVPALKEWQHAATTDTQTIVGWFDHDGEFEGFNLGVATGRASNLWVLDVDLGHGDAAAASFERLEAAYGPLPATRVAVTASGGLHYWFAWPDEVPHPETGELPTWHSGVGGVFGAGIDVRAERGQVVVWPSVLADGSAYAAGEGEPVKLPRDLAEVAVYHPPVTRGFVARSADLDPAAQTRAGRYAQHALDGVLADLDELTAAATDDPRHYRGKPWNETTFKKACRLVELANADWSGIDLESAAALLHEHAPHDADFTAETVDRIWDSALRKVGGAAATLPLDLVNDSSLLADEPRAVGTLRPGTAVEAPRRRSRRAPGDYFDEVTGLQAELLATDVVADDLGLGADGLFWVYAGGVWRPEQDVVAKRVARLLRNQHRHSYVSTVEDLVRAADLPDLHEPKHEHLINTRSGMVNWKTGDLLPHDPALKSTIQLPVEWQPAATCPRFDRWVADVVPPAVATRLWEILGYMVAPGNPLQRAVLLYGDGGNGKGTLIRVLSRLIGPWNVSSVTLRSMSEGRFEVAELYGKQANLAGDIDARYLKDTSMFKSLTGQDIIQAQRKHQRPFEFVCTAVPLFSANELWRSSDNSEGYHRRWVHLPMTRKVRGLGALDEDDLFAELPGILVKAVAHYRALMIRGDFSDSVETALVRDQFAQASDLVRIWLAEDDEIDEATAGVEGRPALEGTAEAVPWQVRTVLYDRFKRWSEETGHGTMSATKFFDRLDHLGFVPKGRPGGRAAGGGRGYYGIKLRSHHPAAEPRQVGRY